MGNPDFKTISAQALTLSEDDRASLARLLVESLDGPADVGVEQAWETEVMRRLSQVDAGTEELIDREEFRRRMRSRFGRS